MVHLGSPVLDVVLGTDAAEDVREGRPWRQSPPPDHPRTLVPRHILAEFGLGPEAGPAEPARKTGADR